MDLSPDCSLVTAFCPLVSPSNGELSNPKANILVSVFSGVFSKPKGIDECRDPSVSVSRPNGSVFPFSESPEVGGCDISNSSDGVLPQTGHDEEEVTKPVSYTHLTLPTILRV